MFIVNAIYMEYNVSHKYNGKKFNFATGFPIIMSSLLLVISLGIKLVRKEPFKTSYLNPELIISALFQSFASYGTAIATLRLNFLMKILIRSSKFLTLLFGAFIFSKNHIIKKRDLFWGIVLTAGVVIFQLGNRKSKSGVTVISGFFFGIFSLVCDSCVSHYQKEMKAKVQYSYFDLIIGTNFWMCLFSFLLSIVTMEIGPMTTFFIEHPKSFFDILNGMIFLVGGVFGIYYHLHHFGPVSVAYICTFRKVISILLSIYIYNHNMGLMH
jgi:UDP-galactose transporter B1